MQVLSPASPKLLQSRKILFENLNLLPNLASNKFFEKPPHYYPFGLTMAGISSKAAGKLENKRKFNDGTQLESKEFSDGSGLELYSTDFRSYDPQIGRFHQIDPAAELTYSYSLFSYAGNNPIYFNDPLGLTPDTVQVNHPVVTVIAPEKKSQPNLSATPPSPNLSSLAPAIGLFSTGLGTSGSAAVSFAGPVGILGGSFAIGWDYGQRNADQITD
jgi:RHS repeat-associated protein